MNPHLPELVQRRDFTVPHLPILFQTVRFLPELVQKTVIHLPEYLQTVHFLPEFTSKI